MSRSIQFIASAAAALLMLTGAASAHASSPPSTTSHPRHDSSGMTVNVKTDGGAKGDGLTDDSQAFKNAINTLSASGGTLVIPGGTYLIRPSAFISIPSNVDVDGQNATLKAADYGYALLGLSGSHIAISGVTVDGDDKVVRGIEMGPSTSSATFTDVAISRNTIENIRQPADPSSPEYLDVAAGIRIEGNGDGIRINSTTIKNIAAVNFNSWTTPVARGIWITPAGGEATSKDITIQDSSFANVTPKDDGDCIVIQGNASDINTKVNLKVFDNSFDACAKRAVKIQLPGALIEKNHIHNPYHGNNLYLSLPASQNTFDMYSAISVYASDVTVSQNLVDGVGSFYNAIEIGAASSLSNVAVELNLVRMGPDSNLTYSSSIRVFVLVNGLTIRQNLLDYATWGIRIDAAPTNADISDNVILHTTYPTQCVSSCGAATS